MIEELKLFAIALKMNSAFLTVDKRSQVWIDEGWSTKTLEDLRKEAADSEGAVAYNDLKNNFLDMQDDFEKAVKDLRGKLQRFEQDPYSQGTSPILRYERKVDQYGVKGKLFLGLNSHQAKGYRIIELDHPRWLEQLMQEDPDVFRSENFSEGEVYALVPGKGIDQEKLSVLNSDYFEDLEKLGVPAFDTFKGYKELKPEFISRLNKTIDVRLPFDANVLRLQALVEAIKREHALAVPLTRAVATGPPKLTPLPKTIEAKRPAPKYTKNQEVRYQGATYLILDSAFQNGEWLYELNAPGVSLFKPEKEIEKLLEQPLLSIYTVPGVRFVEGFEESGAAFRKADEMRRQFPGSVYRVVKPDVLQHKLHPFEVWLVNRGYEVPEKIRVAEPIKTVSTPLYTTADVTPKYELPESIKDKLKSYFVATAKQYGFDDVNKLEGEFKEVIARASSFERGIELINNWLEGLYQKTKLTEEEKETAFFKEMEKEIKKRGYSVAGNLWVSVKLRNFRVTPTYADAQEIVKKLLAKGLIVQDPPNSGIYKLPSPAAASSEEEIKEEAKLEEEAEEEVEDERELVEAVNADEAPTWEKGMPLTDEQIEQAKEDAIMHIADEHIPRTVLMVYDQQGKDAALKVLKENMMSFGQGGPDTPDIMGTAKGVWVTNDIMTPADAANASPSDAKLLTWTELLDYILRWNELKAQAYNKPAAAAPPVKSTIQPPKVTQPKAVTSSAAPAPTPRPTRILSSEDMRLLQDYWNTQFIRAIGKVPAGFSSVFRIEFQEVKMLPFADAKAAILAAADREIAGIEQMQRARETVKQGERFRPEQPTKKAPSGRREEGPAEEGEEGFQMPAGGKVPPSAFPVMPLSVGQPFPRGPTSLEQIRLWKVFCFDMQTEGYDCSSYSREFAEYISQSQFLSWEDLKTKFEFFENTVMEGATLPPLVQWRSKLTTPTGLKGELKELEPSPEPAKLTTQQIENEEKNAVKRQRILISHWASVLIHQARYYRKEKTMSDLYDEVVSRGVIDASIPEEIFIPIAKEAIREISSQKLRPVELMKTDGEEEEVEKLNIAKVPWVDISPAEVEEFLATG